MYFDIPTADRRNQNALTPDLVANALANSTDAGVTIVLSKLDLLDIPAESARSLAAIGRSQADNESPVERLTLGNNRLSTLPTEFTSLSRLRYLNLKHNSFTRFPDVVTLLPALDTLDISHNKITSFPIRPGQLTQLRVFSFSRNKIRQLPTYFPQFRNLEVLKLDRNPIEWPPQNVLDFDKNNEAERPMGKWIQDIREWIEYHPAIQDDSGYGENIEIRSFDDSQRSPVWQFPRRNGTSNSIPHSRSFSTDSGASGASEPFIDRDTPSDNHWRIDTNGPSHSIFHDSHLTRDVYVSSPVGSDRYDPHSISSQRETAEDSFDHSQLLSHLRTSSAAIEHRSVSEATVPPKQSLPDLRSPHWRTRSRDHSVDAPVRLQSSLSQHSIQSFETQSDATPTGHTPSMAFERNSYFQRLSTLPQPVKLPPPLMCLVETARSILFITSQIYQTIEHYANHAIDEKHSSVFKRVLEPANTDMVQLIRSLDRFDTSSRKGPPSASCCRALMESCRNTIAVTNKAVGLFAIQLRVAPCEDFRYSRWILLELYASTAEISVAWRNLAPHSESLKFFLSGRLETQHMASDSFSSLHAPSGDSLHPAPRLRNMDLASIRTHNARRHAGSFSHRDVEIGKELPDYGEAPELPSIPIPPRNPIQALRIAPKRQATAPPSMSGSSASNTVPIPALMFPKSAGVEENGYRRNRHEDSSGPSISVTRQRSGDLRVRVGSETIQRTLDMLESASSVWDLVEETLGNPDPPMQEHNVFRARELHKKLATGFRSSLDNDSTIDTQLSEDILVFFKIVNQLRNSVRSRSSLSRLRTPVTGLAESLDDLVKLLHLPSAPPATGQSYSMPFTNPFQPTTNLDDNRLGSSLSRTRSAQPTPSIKTSFSGQNDGPRSAIPTSTLFKIPSISRVPSRDPWTESPDPG